jgi:hypothetical protein
MTGRIRAAAIASSFANLRAGSAETARGPPSGQWVPMFGRFETSSIHEKVIARAR